LTIRLSLDRPAKIGSQEELAFQMTATHAVTLNKVDISLGLVVGSQHEKRSDFVEQAIAAEVVPRIRKTIAFNLIRTGEVGCMMMFTGIPFICGNIQIDRGYEKVMFDRIFERRPLSQCR
jgi:hypothetical protein